MKVTSEKRHKTVAKICIVLFLFTTAFTGCSHDCNEFEPSAGDNDYITLRLTIPFSTVTTRTGNQKYEEVDSTFPSFEDFINPNDIGIFFFLGEENDAPLVGKWALLAKESKDPNTSMTGYGSHYVITLKMTREDLYKAKPDINIGPNSLDVVKFRVVTLANEKIKKTEENDYSNYDKYKTYKALIDAAYTQTLSLGTSFYSIQNGQFVSSIPMFGTCLFEIKANELYYTRPDEVIDLGDIYMLRCLVKVRLVDNTVKNAQGYPKISCEKKITGKDGGLNYIYRRAYNLPLDAINYQNGFQVDDIHLCTNSTYASYVGNITNTGKEIYSSYCPEQLAETNKEELPFPRFSFSYQMSEGEIWKTDTIHLRGTALPNGDFGLIRNHIYTVEVTNETTTRSGKSDSIHVTLSDQVL